MIALMSGTCEIRVPTFRRPKLLRRALISVLQQTYTDWRCIVFDDCRQKSAQSVVHEMHDSRITYYQNRLQLGALGNIDKAFDPGPILGGRYAFVLEDDNYLMPTHIDNSVGVLTRENVPVVFCNQYCETAEFADEPGAMTNIRTLDWMYEPGTHAPDELLPSLLFSHGFSNGAAFWRTDCRSNFQIGPSTLSTGIQESLRLLELKDPVHVSMDATSVWRGREPEGTPKKPGLSIKSFIRTVRARMSYAMIEKERIDYQCEVLRRLGLNRVLDFIAKNEIPDFAVYKLIRVRSIERTMLLCGYNVRLTKRHPVDRTTCLALGVIARQLISPRKVWR
jgi:hypothetical protein